jgi:ATP-dependent helicase HrpA
MAAHGGVVWDAEGFERLREAVRPRLVPALEEVLGAVTGVLSAWHDLRTRLDAEQRPALATSVADMRAQLDRLVGPGFVTTTGPARLADVARSLQALDVRLRKLPEDPARDRLHTAQVARVQAEVDDVTRRVPPSPAVDQVRWMVEELRISLFAQPMRTRGPVSDKRIFKALDALLP